MSKKEFLTRYIEMKIVTGGYRIGEKIPSERYFSATFNLSRTSVQTAMSNLVKLGFIVSEPKRGYLVVDSILNSYSEFPMQEMTIPSEWSKDKNMYKRRFMDGHSLVGIEEFTPLGIYSQKDYILKDSTNALEHFVSFGIMPTRVEKEINFHKEHIRYNNSFILCNYKYFYNQDSIGEIKLWLNKKYMKQNTRINFI